MAVLTVIENASTRQIPFRAEDEPLLDVLLAEGGIAVPHPCGGRGVCGKCAVNIVGALSVPDDTECQLGRRLSCRTHLCGDAVLDLRGTDLQIDSRAADIPGDDRFAEGELGVACDIGTTTVVLGLYDLRSGKRLALASERNPQTVVAADVIGRIAAALDGKDGLLCELIASSIRRLTDRCLSDAARDRLEIRKTILTGNTTMLYLLMHRSPETLSHAPFAADFLFGTDERIDGENAYLPPCISAFVGADVTCAVEASGMTEQEEISLLCDVGTNGELALWKDGVLYVTSTAAGPAFEGAGISSGCEAVSGAIDTVRFENGSIRYTTIGGIAPRGICGSGIIDAAATLLDAGQIDESGLLAEEWHPAENVRITQKDIREIQLAKAAIAAGIAALTEAAGIGCGEIGTFYIAGGFGKHLSGKSAVRIGLFPAALAQNMKVIGNAALDGAARALTAENAREKLDAIRKAAVFVSLGGDKRFSELYLQNMFFPS